jgi:hypothetical protein
MTQNDLYVLWPDGEYCLLDDYHPSEWQHKNNDYTVATPIKYDDVGEPVFSGQLTLPLRHPGDA